MLLRMTPLTRLTMAFEAELDLAKDRKLEAELEGKFLARLMEAQKRRDLTLRGLLVLDAAVAFVLSGKNITFPETTFSTIDIPALTEICVCLSSAAAYMFVISFTSWLCYNQIYLSMNSRRAKRISIDPDLINLSEVNGEPALKMLRSKLNIWGVDWFQSRRPFSLISSGFVFLNAIFFLLPPIIHFSLVSFALIQLIGMYGFDFVHSVLYVWIVISHFLAVYVWVVPSVTFSFEVSDLPQ